jgi:hypothetical protein
LPEVTHAKRGVDRIDVGRPDLQVLHEEVPDGRRHAGIHGDAHHRTEAAIPHAPLHRLQEVLRLQLLDDHLGIAEHPERVGLHDLHPGKQAGQVRGDELLQPYQDQGAHLPVTLRGLARHGDGHEARQGVGDLDAGKSLPAEGIADHHGLIQALVGDVGEGTSGVIGQRRQDREDHPLEIRVGRRPVRLGQGGVIEDVDAGLGELRQELAQDRSGALHQFPCDLADLRQLLPRRQPVDGGFHHRGRHLLFEAGYPHHEELGEIRADDGQELDALEKRVPLVLGLFEHAAEEGQETQLAIEVEGRVLRHGGRRGPVRRPCGLGHGPAQPPPGRASLPQFRHTDLLLRTRQFPVGRGRENARRRPMGASSVVTRTMRTMAENIPCVRRGSPPRVSRTPIPAKIRPRGPPAP